MITGTVRASSASASSAPSASSAFPAPQAGAPISAAALGAFEEIYRTHHRRVYALVLRLVRDGRRAEELTQDVFVRAWRALPRFGGRSAVGTWLHAIAVRTVLNDARSRTRRENRLEPVEDWSRFGRAARDAMPDTRLDLETAIASLPDGARTALVLHDVEGYTHEEIAGMLGVTAGTVKSQLHRARRKMMEALGR